jgi:hypothetical protein
VNLDASSLRLCLILNVTNTFSPLSDPDELTGIEMNISSRCLEDFIVNSPSFQPRKKLVVGPPLSPRTAAGFHGQEFDALDSGSSSGMSSTLRVTSEYQTVVLKSGIEKDNLVKETVIQTIRGDRLATLEYSADKTRRVLCDANGNRCAIVLRSFVNGQNRFKICSDKPMNTEHRRSNESGYYTWADVKNSKGLLDRVFCALFDELGKDFTWLCHQEGQGAVCENDLSWRFEGCRPRARCRSLPDDMLCCDHR